MKKQTLYPILGAVIGVGAAILSVFVRFVTAGPIQSPAAFFVHEVTSNLYFYLYMGCGAVTILTLAGRHIGQLHDRLIAQNRELDRANQDLNRLLQLHAESEEKYQHAVDQAGDAILFIATDTEQIVDANAKTLEVTGFTKAELTGRKIWELCPQSSRERMGQLLERIEATGEAAREELVFFDKRGQRIDVEVSASLIQYKETRVIQQIWRDVTERKSLERQLRHADKLASIGRLASGIAHEVGNPLGSISAYAQILLMGGESESDRMDYLRAIESESRRINALINHLLDFSRPPADHIEWVEVNYIIEQALSLVSAQKRFKAIHATKNLTTPSPRVRIDADQLKQVLINLYLNASDAMPEGGALTVESAMDNQFISIRVTDTGVGIKPADLERIFDPFFTTKSEGTGLGLATSARLIEKYGGVIEAHSEEKCGSTFTVILPRSAGNWVESNLSIDNSEPSIWSIESPTVRNLKALPRSKKSEDPEDERWSS